MATPLYNQIQSNLDSNLRKVWTGTDSNWTQGKSCRQFTSSSSVDLGNWGDSASTTTSFISDPDPLGCNNHFMLYCVEQLN